MDEKLIAPELPVQKDPLSTDFEKGWHKVFSCEDLEVNKAISIDDFATQIVVWRGADGIVRALDLFCKHMGASLECGEVDGNCIRCPFHAWRWNDEGNCDDIGYANKIPPKAKTRSWKVKEEDGSIMVWYDPEEV